MLLAVGAAGGAAGVSTPGQHGLFIEQGKEYEGYFFAKVAVWPGKEAGAGRRHDSALGIRISLFNRDTNLTIGSSVITLHSTPGKDAVVYQGFEKVQFSIVATGDAACTSVIRCAGEFRLELVSAGGRINIDFVYMSPGAWGRYQNLPVLLSGANILLEMGIASIRQGGSFAGNSPWYPPLLPLADTPAPPAGGHQC